MTIDGTAHEGLEEFGREIADALTNYERSESGGRETWTATSASPHTITLRLEQASVAPSPDRNAMATGEVATSTTIYVKDTVTGIRDGGGEGASEITVDGQTYVVVQQTDQDNGLYALHCERV